MALLIVNPNPVFDRTITVPELVPGAVIRTLDVELTAGGKGVNVARALRALGDPAPLLIPVGADDAPRFTALLRGEGADLTVIEVPGPVRVASIYLEERASRVTVVNDAGHSMDPREWERVLVQVQALVAPGDIVLCMGSFPPGLDSDALTGLIRVAHRADARILVDTSPAFLSGSLSARPDVVVPNLDEALAALEGGDSHVMDAHGHSADEIRHLAMRAATDLVARGAARAIVTAGAEGAAMATDTALTWVPAHPVVPLSTVGAGDSLVAGIAHVWQRSGDATDWTEALAMGVACAAASCEQVRAGGIDPDRVMEINAAVLRRVGTEVAS